MQVTRGLLVGLALSVGSTRVFAETARAHIQPSAEESAVTGTATLTDSPGGLKVDVQIADAAPGQHGLHIHQYGDCSDHANAAGAHYNPRSATHGFLPADGLDHAHPGDLGNIEVGPDGSGTLSLVLPGVSLSGGTYSVAGRAMVVHDKLDDFSQPAGNAGARVGCGVILISKE